LRIALLTMLETTGQSPAGIRAALRVGGISIARHQLSLALALQCERIICIARALSPEIAAIQHAAEQAGAGFHLITETRPLVGLVTSIDEVVVIADGLLATPEEATSLLDTGACILVQPVESGLQAGFERIDLSHAAAGAMRLPGRLVERLADLPPDCDAVSALQRIALQAGVRQCDLPAGLRESGAWRLVRDESEAPPAESEWIRARTAPRLGAAPSDVAIRAAVRSFGPTLLHGGGGGNGLRIGAFVGLLLALGAGWFGLAVFALLLAGLAWAVRRASEVLLEIERSALRRARPALLGEDIFTWALDAVLVLVVAWNIAGMPDDLGFVGRVFPATILVLMLRVVPRALAGRWAGWFSDRALAAIALAVLALGGLRAEVICSLAAALALFAAVWPIEQSRLTRT
jgi:hypothetical protein